MTRIANKREVFKYLVAKDGLLSEGQQAKELNVNVGTVRRYRKLLNAKSKGMLCKRKFNPKSALITEVERFVNDYMENNNVR